MNITNRHLTWQYYSIILFLKLSSCDNNEIESVAVRYCSTPPFHSFWKTRTVESIIKLYKDVSRLRNDHAFEK
jgi:hypothetical protein